MAGSQYDYNAASQVINFNTGSLSIPGGGEWSQYISSLAGRLTQGKATPNDMRAIAAAQAMRSGPDGRGGGLANTATQFMEGLSQNLRNINAPEAQIVSLLSQINRLAAHYFPARPTAAAHGPVAHRMAPHQAAQAHQYPTQAPRGLSGPPMPVSRPQPYPGSVVARVAVPMAIQAGSPSTIRVQVTGQPLPGVIPAPMPLRVIAAAPPPPPPQWAPPPAPSNGGGGGTYGVAGLQGSIQGLRAQPVAPQGQGYNPAAVIQQGLADMRLSAFKLANRIKSGDQSAIGYLAGQRVNAQNGDWNARQFLTFVQTALQQIGHDPSYARWSGEGSFPHTGHDHGYGASNSSGMETNLVGCHTQDYIDALSLINRARSYDQNAIATLQTLRSGGARAQRILRCVTDIQGRDPSFGAAQRRPSNAARTPASPPAPKRHPAVTALRSAPKSTTRKTAATPKAAGLTPQGLAAKNMGVQGTPGAGSPLAGMNMLGAVARQAGGTVVSPSQAAATAMSQSTPSSTPTAASVSPSIAKPLSYSGQPYNPGSGGGGGGGGPTDGGSSGGGGDDSGGGSDDSGGGDDTSFSFEPSGVHLGDRGLHPATGMPVNPHADSLVRRARAGDPRAKMEIGDAIRMSRTGDPRARALAAALLQRTAGAPDIAGEIANGHAANLSHSHPLTDRRVGKIGEQVAAQYGARGTAEYHAHVASPHGAISPSMPAWTGQVVGRAQAMQAARFPNGRIRFVSPRAAREMGEK